MDTAVERATLSKVAWRLIPFMFVMYIFNYLDRTNVGFARLQMQQQLHMSDAAFGAGAGVFFLGYFLFELPSNLILERTGARLWIARIMITWGIISSAMMFTRSVPMFYGLRFLLGLAEAGFFPGMILYLTYWFPAAERARAIARFMTATPLAGAFGNPVSGVLLDKLHGIGGMQGWQWLFLIEGLPSFLLGFVVLFYLTDRPEKAHWLTPEEKQCLTDRLGREEDQRLQKHSYTLGQALTNPTVALLAAVYFTLQIGFYGYTFWLPKIVKGFGLTNTQTGLLSSIPYFVAALAMVIAGTLSDRAGDRKRFLAGASVIAAIGLAGSAAVVRAHLSAAAGIPVLTLAAIGLWSTLGPFWSLPTSFLSRTAAAGCIAMINSVGNLGGYFGPVIMGRIEDMTHSNVGGLLVLAGSLFLSGLLALAVYHDPELERPQPAVEPPLETAAR